jgi:hypothetical protein
MYLALNQQVKKFSILLALAKLAVMVEVMLEWVDILKQQQLLLFQLLTQQELGITEQLRYTEQTND